MEVGNRPNFSCKRGSQRTGQGLPGVANHTLTASPFWLKMASMLSWLSEHGEVARCWADGCVLSFLWGRFCGDRERRLVMGTGFYGEFLGGGGIGEVIFVE